MAENVDNQITTLTKREMGKHLALTTIQGMGIGFGITGISLIATELIHKEKVSFDSKLILGVGLVFFVGVMFFDSKIEYTQKPVSSPTP